MACAFPKDVLSAARLGDAHFETLVFLFIDKVVILAVGSQLVAVKPVLALGGVLNGIENSLIVIGPGNRSGFLRDVSQILAGAQVPDMEAILAEPGVVSGIGEQVGIVTDIDNTGFRQYRLH